jgi:hypothetical protein
MHVYLHAMIVLLVLLHAVLLVLPRVLQASHKRKLQQAAITILLPLLPYCKMYCMYCYVYCHLYCRPLTSASCSRLQLQQWASRPRPTAPTPLRASPMHLGSSSLMYSTGSGREVRAAVEQVFRPF